MRYLQHVAACFTPEKWQRLQALRREHDPHGVFHGYVSGDSTASA